MFPVRDWKSEKESWYIPGTSVKFDSFDEALTWLIDFLEWLQEHEKFKELVQELEVFFQSPFFQGIFEEYPHSEEADEVEEDGISR